jgi:putative ABC transport system permease protein
VRAAQTLAVRFSSFILKNLLRERVRTLLTVLGIAVGITTVVALGVVTDGFTRTAGQIIDRGGASFMVVQRGAADMTFSSLPEADVEVVARKPGVARAFGALMHVSKVEQVSYFPLTGIAPAELPSVVTNLRTGRLPVDGADEIVLGQQAASVLHTGLGDHVRIAGHALLVVGLYQSSAQWDAGGAYSSLATVQRLSGRRGTVSAVYVLPAARVDAGALAARIERELPTATTISSVSEYGKVDQGYQMLGAVQLAIELLAVGIGAIGVTNTMIMSVFERTREIGILRAVGWSRRRIMLAVLGESVALCVIASVVGAVLGTVAGRLVTDLPQIRTLIAPSYDVSIYLRALASGLFVGLLGAAYPSVRATRLTPMEALRHE